MTAVTHDIIIEQGATFAMHLVYESPADTPVNLTGYTARMQVRRSHKATEKLLDFTTENGAITLGGALGTIDVVGLATLTDDLPSKPAVYDLELVGPTGEVKRLIEGSATITPEVTRP